MKRIITTLALILTASIALANNSGAISLILAGELNATAGCPIQETVSQENGACWTLGFDIQTHQSLMNLTFMQYNDVNLIGPWQAVDGGLIRIFTIDGDSTTYALMLLEFGRSSIGVVAPAE